MQKIFQNKKVFITGGSSGIGKAIAIQLSRLGAHVGIAARNQVVLDQAFDQIKEAALLPAQRFGAWSLDVSKRTLVNECVPKVVKELGGLDILIANSGFAAAGYVHKLEDKDFEKLMQVNYWGHVHAVRACLPNFMQQRSGRICMVSSMLGFMSMFGYTAYSASKYAIAGFAEGLRHELKPKNIQVSIFYPPTTETPGLAKENQTKPKAVWAMEADSGWNKIYTAEQVAHVLVKSLATRRFEHVVGWDSKFIFFMMRHFPNLSRKIADMELKKAEKKVKD